jgi:hypothetical protein
MNDCLYYQASPSFMRSNHRVPLEEFTRGGGGMQLFLLPPPRRTSRNLPKGHVHASAIQLKVGLLIVLQSLMLILRCVALDGNLHRVLARN